MGRHTTAPAGRRHPAGWYTRARALLTGALVLGVGGAVTVAAWNDSEIAQANFTASTFSIEGSVDGATFSEHSDAANAAALTFSAPFDAMSPGTTVYALFSVQTTSATTTGGTVTLAAASGNADGLGQWLTYAVRTTSGTTCNAAAFDDGTPVAADGTDAHSLSAAGANQVNYCFAITLPTGTPNSAQGTSVDAAWTFTATSGS